MKRYRVQSVIGAMLTAVVLYVYAQSGCVTAALGPVCAPPGGGIAVGVLGPVCGPIRQL